ncbi:MAG: hypothetical protein WD296_11005 [Acidimicrobiia bacterium]
MNRRGRVVVVALVVALGSLWAPTAYAKGQPKAPKEWDERVLPFVDFVEEQRGLDFDHPVKVRFLSDKQLEKELRSDQKLTKNERELDKQLAGELLALGLVGEQIDLSQASEDLAAESVVGYYDPETEELVVRSKGAKSIDARVTIVHELVHTVQDQHFDIDKLYDKAKDGSQAYALDFLLEGDATTVENAYLDTLSPADQDEYYGFVEDVVGEELPEGVPYALDVYSSAPYILGEAFVYALDPEGGTSGRDRAFKNPPKTEEVLIDPVALKQRQPAKKVPKPKLTKGEKRAYAPEQFGVITLYLMLSTRLDARTALEAVTGWGGDRYVGFQKAGDACVRVNITGDTDLDTDQLEDALTAWMAEMPDGAVQVSRDGEIVAFTACESEGVTEPTIESFESAFYNVLGGRVFTVLDVASAGVPLGTALCVGDFVSTDPEVIALFDEVFAEGREPTEAEYVILDDSYVEAFPACGANFPA